MRISPHNWAQRFFRWYCHPLYLEDLEGDLTELYQERLEHLDPHKAQWLYVRDVLLLLRPSIIRPFNIWSPLGQKPAIFRNHLKLGARLLVRHPGLSLLNILGLAIGMAATILLLLTVQYEKSFDTFHANYDNIYQLGERITTNSTTKETYYTRTPAFAVMRADYPEIVGGSRFEENQHRIGSNGRLFTSSVHYVDTSFATTFSFPVIWGDMIEALHTPNHLVLTQTAAQQFFGDKNPIGKTLKIDQDGERFIHFTVGAVIKNPPPTSSLQFEILISWFNVPESYSLSNPGSWYSTNMMTFLQLYPDTDPAVFAKKLDLFKEKHYVKFDGAQTDIILLPLAQTRSKNTQNTLLVIFLGGTALLIFVVGLVNYINLSTAQVLRRVKEVEVRKTLGFQKHQLITQFVTESSLTIILALLVAVVLVYLMLPFLNTYYGLVLRWPFWSHPSWILLLVGIGLVAGLLAGGYPALLLARLQSVTSLQSRGNNSRRTHRWQKGLIIAQFSCAILLIAGAIIVERQTQFMRTHELNFDQDHIVAIRVNGNKFKSAEQSRVRLSILSQALKQNPDIEAVAFSSTVPSKYWRSYDNFYPVDSSQAPISLRKTSVGDRYFATYGIDIVEGRSFSSSIAADSNAVIINQTAMKALGWQSIEGKYFCRKRSKYEVYPVIGVTEDFHYQGLQHEIEPLAHLYRGSGSDYPFMSVRIRSDHVQQNLAMLKAEWRRIGGIGELDYFFIDDAYDQLYQGQDRLTLTAMFFMIVSFVMASFGLLGFATFSSHQRRREVGVRKAMGASTWQLLLLLSRSYVLLVAIAFLVACPIIYFFSQYFLQQFAYRISLSPDIFLVSGLAAFFTGSASVSYQAFRAAFVNTTRFLQ